MPRLWKESKMKKVGYKVLKNFPEDFQSNEHKNFVKI